MSESLGNKKFDDENLDDIDQEENFIDETNDSWEALDERSDKSEALDEIQWEIDSLKSEILWSESGNEEKDRLHEWIKWSLDELMGTIQSNEVRKWDALKHIHRLKKVQQDSIKEKYQTLRNENKLKGLDRKQLRQDMKEELNKVAILYDEIEEKIIHYFDEWFNADEEAKIVSKKIQRLKARRVKAGLKANVRALEGKDTARLDEKQKRIEERRIPKAELKAKIKEIKRSWLSRQQQKKYIYNLKNEEVNQESKQLRDDENAENKRSLPEKKYSSTGKTQELFPPKEFTYPTAFPSIPGAGPDFPQYLFYLSVNTTIDEFNYLSFEGGYDIWIDGIFYLEGEIVYELTINGVERELIVDPLSGEKRLEDIFDFRFASQDMLTWKNIEELLIQQEVFEEIWLLMLWDQSTTQELENSLAWEQMSTLFEDLYTVIISMSNEDLLASKNFFETEVFEVFLEESEMEWNSSNLKINNLQWMIGYLFDVNHWEESKGPGEKQLLWTRMTTFLEALHQPLDLAVEKKADKASVLEFAPGYTMKSSSVKGTSRLVYGE